MSTTKMHHFFKWSPYDVHFPGEGKTTPEDILAIINAIIIIISAFILLLVIGVVTGLIWYHFNFRPMKWLQITKTMHQRLSGQILKEENLKEFCELIGVSSDFIHLDRKEQCASAENIFDLPPARYVDPFKAPSNLYDQAAEKDDDFKTFKNLDNDIFLKKDDLKVDGTKQTATPGISASSARPSQSGIKGDNAPPQEKKPADDKKVVPDEKKPTEEKKVAADEKKVATEEKKPAEEKKFAAENKKADPEEKKSMQFAP